jgi:hypothetical protein
MTRAFALAGLIVAAALVPGGPAVVAEAQEGWEATLKLQLDVEKKCQFERLVSVRQLPVEGLGGLEGRVRCHDGREFDFSRQKAHQKFEIRLCMPAVC